MKSLVNLSFRGTEEYRVKLQQAALDRRIKVQELLERAVDYYLETGGSQPGADCGDITDELAEAASAAADIAATLRRLQRVARQKTMSAGG